MYYIGFILSMPTGTTARCLQGLHYIILMTIDYVPLILHNTDE